MAASWGSTPVFSGPPQSSVYQQSPPATDGQARVGTCYNCGAYDHYLVACPEPTRKTPAGLAAARAAEAVQAGSSVQYRNPVQSQPDYRAVKRQKTGPIVTRYPLPNNGPVVTRYFANGAPYSASQMPGPHGYQMTQFQQNGYPSHVSQTPQTQGFGVHNPGTTFTQYAQQPSGVRPQYGQHMVATPGYPAHMPQAFQPSSMPPHAHMPQHNQNHHHMQPGPGAGLYGHGIQHPQIGMPKSQNMPGPYTQPQGFGSAQGSFSNNTSYSHPAMLQPSQWSPTGNGSVPYNGTHYAQGMPPKLQPPYHHNVKSPFQSRSASMPNARALPAYGEDNVIAPTVAESPTENKKAESPTKDTFETTEADESYDWDLTNAFREPPPSKRDAVSITRPLSHLFDSEEQPVSKDATTGIISKYIRPANLEVYMLEIRSSLHWAHMKGDPVFNPILWTAPQVALTSLDGWSKERYVKNEPDFYRDEGQVSARKRAWSDDIQDDVDKQLIQEVSIVDNKDDPQARASLSAWDLHEEEQAHRSRSGTPVVERGLTPCFTTADDPWAPQPGEGQTSHRLEDASLVRHSGGDLRRTPETDPTEALLASLGVTGVPRPVENSAVITPIQDIGSVEKANTPSDILTPGRIRKNANRQDSGYVTARGSHSVSNELGPNQSLHSHEQPRHYRDSRPPPPPPPPQRQHFRKQTDGSLESPASDNSGSADRDRTRSENDQEQEYVEGDSPLSPTSAALLGQMSQTDRANGKRPEPLRQVDDVTPKLRRRQPKVADAYSRRW